MSPATLLVLSVCVLTCSGCGTTTGAGLAAAVAVAKPLSCMGARVWLREVCGETVGPCPVSEDTSGGEAP